MIKIMIVDDSKTETELLKNLFNAEQDMEVIACAKNGKEAIELALKLKPDLITMDICMPVMDGIEAIKHIMRQVAIPIVVISSKLNDKIINGTYEALAAGALSVLDKPTDITSIHFNTIRRNMIDTLRSMAEIKVIRRKLLAAPKNSKLFSTPTDVVRKTRFEIIGIGSSVGGPQALKAIISKLPADFPVPIIVVQHMTAGYIAGFSEWLNKQSLLKIKEVENDEVLRGGYVYFAPDHYHVEIERSHFQLKAKLIKGLPVSGFCPSATVLLQSISKISKAHALGILLTGMGDDGALGLLNIKQMEGHTIIQDPESATVFGMGRVALSLGAVDKIIKLDEIADYLSVVASASR